MEKWLGKSIVQGAARAWSGHPEAAALLRRREAFKQQLVTIATSRETALGAPDNGCRRQTG